MVLHESIFLNFVAIIFVSQASAFLVQVNGNNVSRKVLLKTRRAKNSSWEHGRPVISKPYVSTPLMQDESLQTRLLSRLEELDQKQRNINKKNNDALKNTEQDSIFGQMNQISNYIDPLWEQIKMEAELTVQTEPSAVGIEFHFDVFIFSDSWWAHYFTR